MGAELNRPTAEPNPRPGFRGHWWVGAMLAGLAVAILPFDHQISDPQNLASLRGDVIRCVTLSEFFAHGYGVAIIAIGIWLLAPAKKTLIPRIVVCAIWPSLVVNLVKTLFGRFRPTTYFEKNSIARFPTDFSETWTGWLPGEKLNLLYDSQSLPSGHAATAWGLAIGMTWAFPKGKWLFMGLAVMASVQRVTSFAHWPSDVLCGAAFGIVLAGSITKNWGIGYLIRRFENRTAANASVASADKLLLPIGRDHRSQDEQSDKAA